MTAVETHPIDPRMAELETLTAGTIPAPTADAPRVLYLSVYCYHAFAIREFHQMTRLAGLQSKAVFFKDVFTNHHKPITDWELDTLADLTAAFKPDVIAVSLLAPYVPSARKILKRLKEVAPDAVTISGGKHATISPDEALTYADYACKGEGELVLLDVFDRLRQGSKDFRDIKGLWFLGDDGAVVDMGQRPLIENIDAIPYEACGEPDMHFIEDDQHTTRDPNLDSQYMLIMSGRGCVYMCTYCVNSLLIPMNRGNGRFVRSRTPESLIRQIKERQAKQPHLTHIVFNDEVFGVFDDWTKEFSDLYKKEVGLPFMCELVPKLIKEHNMRNLAAAGLYEMHYGIQSGAEHVRTKLLKRPGGNQELIDKGWLLKNLGIQPQCDIILGNPFEDADDMVDTLKMLRDMPRPLQLNIYKMQYFPHYPLTKAALEAGFITEHDVSEDVLADNVMNNMAHKPSGFVSDRRAYLENCVYIVPWDNALVWWVIDRLIDKHDPLMAQFGNFLALWRYHLNHRQNKGLVWLRRLWIGLRALARGDLGSIARRLSGRKTSPHKAAASS